MVYIFGDPSLDVPALQMVNEVVEVLADVVMQPVVDPGEEERIAGSLPQVTPQVRI